jgi:hypothetical protein
MRLFRLTFSLFYDPYWRASFHDSKRTRRYWLAAPGTRAITGRTLALQLGPLTFKLYVQGPARGQT